MDMRHFDDRGRTMSRCSGFRAATALLAVVAVLGSIAQEANAMAEHPFPRRQKAPPLPAGLTWINAAGPLELADFRGKFVLLDFWTFCCINCMHILPELHKLEQAYPKNLVVVGVHSAKFAGEKDTKNISDAVLRYRIEHPVVNDADHEAWNRYGVQAWPTLVLIDPEGYAVWAVSGETTFDVLSPIIKGALPYYRAKGLLDETPLRFDLAASRREPTPLHFPGKILADERGERLFVADSNHHRIVVARLDGKRLDVIGSGAPGSADGDFRSAEFNDPQGMALAGDALYVADNRNHLIRRVDLAGKKVTTVAGTGRQRRESPVARPGSPLRTAISSPWDLWIHERDLYVAMAGSHQIWRMRLDGSGIGPYAGNGREDIVDGPLLPRAAYETGYASFAQPSGLASDGDWLYVADSEGSSIRGVPWNPRGAVKTVVGTSRLPAARLFTFGDADGPAETARLQHPLGVACWEGRLYVADTYNNKIKAVDPATGHTRTLAGTGKPGKTDDPPAFDEPAGIAAAAGKLYVADTNNHLVRVIDLRDGNRVSTLRIEGLAPPAPPSGEGEPSTTAGGEVRRLKPVAVRAENGAIRLAVAITLPAGYKINPVAPMAYTVKLAGVAGRPQTGPIRRSSLGKRTRLEKPSARFKITLPVDAATGRDTLEVTVQYYYCQEGKEGLCKAGSVTWSVPLEVGGKDAAVVVPLTHEVR
jgi:thiol-disulfide isomerase/thioredoxin